MGTSSKGARLFGVFVIWSVLLIVFGIIAGMIDSDWPILIPLAGAFVHALTVAMGKR